MLHQGILVSALVSGTDYNFTFNVKFYPPDPAQLSEDITRCRDECCGHFRKGAGMFLDEVVMVARRLTCASLNGCFVFCLGA